MKYTPATLDQCSKTDIYNELIRLHKKTKKTEEET